MHGRMHHRCEVNVIWSNSWKTYIEATFPWRRQIHRKLCRSGNAFYKSSWIRMRPLDQIPLVMKPNQLNKATMSRLMSKCCLQQTNQSIGQLVSCYLYLLHCWLQIGKEKFWLICFSIEIPKFNGSLSINVYQCFENGKLNFCINLYCPVSHLMREGFW